MENKKITQRRVTFLTGVLSGGLLFGLVLLITGSRAPDPQPPANAIDVTTAKSYYQKYMANPLQIEALSGIAIDMDQLSAINSIRTQVPTARGFRIYYGLDNSSNRIGIVVGIDNMGHDITTNIIQTTRNYDPCPPICDTPSPILQN